MQTEKLPIDEYGAYNRRTTDYGNGKMEIAAYHSPRFQHSGITHGACIRAAVLSDEAQEARAKKQIYAIRGRIKGYALSNRFRWFATLTFNPAQVNSRDYGTAKDTLLKWCRRMRDRYSRFDYLLIPELH